MFNFYIYYICTRLLIYFIFLVISLLNLVFISNNCLFIIFASWSKNYYEVYEVVIWFTDSIATSFLFIAFPFCLESLAISFLFELLIFLPCSILCLFAKY